MKIKHLSLATALLAAALFSSCSNENEVVNKGGDGIATRVSFSIAIPKGDPVTYATHDADEWGIESLWLYEYDAAGKLIAAPVDIKGTLVGTGPDYTYEKDINDANKGVRQFLFVANETPDASITIGTFLPVLKAVLATKALAANSSSSTLLNDFGSNKRIPMTGMAKQAGSGLISVTGAPAVVSVEMERIVARVDISNRVPNLVITNVKLAKTNSHSHLFLNGDYQVPAANGKVSGITSFASMPATFDFNVNMLKAFYLYEGHQPTTGATDAVQIEVTGTLAGVPVFYSIPFWKDNKEVVVKRNHIYRLTLGDGQTPIAPGSDVVFTIEDNPWNEVTMNETFAIISATHSGTGTWDLAGHTVSIDNAAHNDITFDFATKFAGHTAFTATILNAPTWISASFAANKMTIAVEANNSVGAIAREAVIEVVSNADANTKYTIKVKQAV